MIFTRQVINQKEEKSNKRKFKERLRLLEVNT